MQRTSLALAVLIGIIVVLTVSLSQSVFVSAVNPTLHVGDVAVFNISSTATEIALYIHDNLGYLIHQEQLSVHGDYLYTYQFSKPGDYVVTVTDGSQFSSTTVHVLGENQDFPAPDKEGGSNSSLLINFIERDVVPGEMLVSTGNGEYKKPFSNYVFLDARSGKKSAVYKDFVLSAYDTLINVSTDVSPSRRTVLLAIYNSKVINTTYLAISGQILNVTAYYLSSEKVNKTVLKALYLPGDVRDEYPDAYYVDYNPPLYDEDLNTTVGNYTLVLIYDNITVNETVRHYVNVSQLLATDSLMSDWYNGPLSHIREMYEDSGYDVNISKLDVTITDGEQAKVFAIPHVRGSWLYIEYTTPNTPSKFLLFDPAGGAWWNSSWTYRRNITIVEEDGYNRTGQQTTLNLTFSPGKISKCEEIRIMDTSDNEVPYRILEDGSSSQTPYCYVQFGVDINSSQTLVYTVYYGNPYAPDPSYTSPNWNLTWVISSVYFPADDLGSVYDNTDYPAPAVVDYDCDGDLDLVYGTDNGRTYVKLNTGSQTDPIWGSATQIINDVGSDAVPDLADYYSSDGDLDAVVGERGGVINYFENTGTCSNPTWTSRGTSSDVGSNTGPSLADMDGDGDYDIPTGEDARLRMFRNTGSQSSPSFSQDDSDMPTQDFGSRVRITVRDLDFDGDPDIIVGENTGQIQLLWNIGNKTDPSWSSSIYQKYANGTIIDVGSYSSPYLADVNNDGYLDLIIGESTGHIAPSASNTDYGKYLINSQLNTSLGSEETVQANMSVLLDTYENDYLYSVLEYETGDTIEWFNITVQPDANAKDVNISFSVKDPQGLTPSWINDLMKQCGDVSKGRNCTQHFQNTTSVGYWKYKREITLVENKGNYFEDYPILITLDTKSLIQQGKMKSDCSDVAFAWVNRTSGLDESVPYFLGTGCNTSNTTFWVRVPKIYAYSNTTVLMFYGGTAGNNVSELELFNLSSHVAFYPVGSNQVDNALVSSFVDGNNITAGGTTLLLDEQENGTIPGTSLNQNTSVYVKGPAMIESTSTGDAFVPISFAGTKFVYRIDRNTNVFYILAPFSDASVQICYGTGFGNCWSNITVAEGSVNDSSSLGDIPDDTATRILSTAPVIIFHQAGATDNFVLHPADTDWWGVASSNMEIAALEDDTDVDIYYSDGSHLYRHLNAGDHLYLSPPSATDSEGRGSAVHIVSSKPIGVDQHADSDGSETTTFLPRYELGKVYYIPEPSQYVAIATTEPYTSCTLYNPDGTVNQTIVGGYANETNPGKIYFGRATDGEYYHANIKIVCNATVFVYHEFSDNDDEHNVWSAIQSRPYKPEPTVVIGSETINGYFVPLNALVGNYTVNFTTSWSNQGTVTNITYFYLHNLPDNMSSILEPDKILVNDSSTYNFTLSNPWSKNLTDVNVTINCPDVLNCTCSGTTNDYCYLGNISDNKTASFNVSTNSSTPAGDYNIN
ncbi:hypothetical protein DRN75_02565, partial [Nanoarchaeota archaeon]